MNVRCHRSLQPPLRVAGDVTQGGEGTGSVCFGISWEVHVNTRETAMLFTGRTAPRGSMECMNHLTAANFLKMSKKGIVNHSPSWASCLSWSRAINAHPVLGWLKPCRLPWGAHLEPNPSSSTCLVLTELPQQVAGGGTQKQAS